MDEAVMPECYVDTNLTETLVAPVKRGLQHGYNHQKGCGTVAKKMQENFADRFALGIIDKDKKELDYLREFDEVIVSNSLTLHKHRTKPHYIIQISPAIERFILANAQAAGISLEAHNLPSDFDKLKREAKRQNSKDDSDFKGLFRAIHKSGAPGFQKLAAWIRYLKERNYEADMDELRAL